MDSSLAEHYPQKYTLRIKFGFQQAYTVAGLSVPWIFSKIPVFYLLTPFVEQKRGSYVGFVF